MSSSKTIDLVAAPIPRAKGTRKNADGRRAYIGWKHAIGVLGNSKKVKSKYCSKTVSGGILDGIFRFNIEREICEVQTQETKISTSQKKGKFVVDSSTGIQKPIN